MNEYSRELMHMTTSEKADYNRKYYQRNKQYWKDYYKTGHGIGRKPGKLSGITKHVTNPSYNTDRSKTYWTLPDGRTKVTRDKQRDRTDTPYHTNGKSLDNHGKQRHEEALDNWNSKNAAVLRTRPGSEEEKKARARENGAFGDLIRELHGNDPYENGKVRPRTANIPRKKIDRIKQAASKTVKEIKEEAGFAANDAKNFVKKIYDEVDYQIWNVGDEAKKLAKKVKSLFK